MIRSMARKEIVLMLKEKGLFFWLIGMPILFIVLFGSVLNKVDDATITVRYVDLDQSEISRQFIETIGKIEGFELKTDTSRTVEEQIEQIREGKQSSLVVVPKGFGENLASGRQATVTLYRDAASDTSVAPIRAVLQNIALQYREQKLSGALARTGIGEAEVKQILLEPVHIEEAKENGTSFNMVAQVVPGYTVMFVFFIMINMVRRFLQDRDSGMIARLASTKMDAHVYLIGMWIPNVLAVLLQCVVLLAFGHYVYRLPLGDLTAISAIIAALALCGTAFGLALAVTSRSENQGNAITQVIALGGALFGGLWFPLDFLPETMRMIARITPQFWAQKALQDVMVRSADLSLVWPSIAVLTGFAAAALLLALWRFRRFVRTATG